MDQTRYFDSPGKGNCSSAAVATILDLPLEEVVDFIQQPFFWGAFYDFFEERGLEAELRADPTRYEPGEYYLASGPSIRGVQHMIVMLDGRVVHDPHPSRTGIIDVDYIHVIHTKRELDE